MKIEIIYNRGKSNQKEVEFNGNNAMAQGMQFIYNNQPINVHAVRINQFDKKDAKDC